MSMTRSGMEPAYAAGSHGRTMTPVKEPTISATEFALTRTEQVRANRKQPGAGVRIAITGRENGAFSYDLSLVASGEERPGDVIVDGPSGVRFSMPLTSVPYLD